MSDQNAFSACETLGRTMSRLHDGRPGWEHASFMSLAGSLTVEQAMWRARPGGRCIWEYVRHMTHWRGYVLARLRAEELPDLEDNWPRVPEGGGGGGGEDSARLWREEIEAFEALHRGLMEELSRLDPDEPHPHPDLANEPYWFAVLGVQIHDSYHLGQVAMLRGLQGLEAVE